MPNIKSPASSLLRDKAISLPKGSPSRSDDKRASSEHHENPLPVTIDDREERKKLY